MLKHYNSPALSGPKPKGEFNVFVSPPSNFHFYIYYYSFPCHDKNVDQLPSKTTRHQSKTTSLFHTSKTPNCKALFLSHFIYK